MRHAAFLSSTATGSPRQATSKASQAAAAAASQAATAKTKLEGDIWQISFVEFQKKGILSALRWVVVGLAFFFGARLVAHYYPEELEKNCYARINLGFLDSDSIVDMALFYISTSLLESKGRIGVVDTLMKRIERSITTLNKDREAYIAAQMAHVMILLYICRDDEQFVLNFFRKHFATVLRLNIDDHGLFLTSPLTWHADALLTGDTEQAIILRTQVMGLFGGLIFETGVPEPDYMNALMLVFDRMKLPPPTFVEDADDAGEASVKKRTTVFRTLGSKERAVFVECLKVLGDVADAIAKDQQDETSFYFETKMATANCVKAAQRAVQEGRAPGIRIDKVVDMRVVDQLDLFPFQMLPENIAVRLLSASNEIATMCCASVLYGAVRALVNDRKFRALRPINPSRALVAVRGGGIAMLGAFTFTSLASLITNEDLRVLDISNVTLSQYMVGVMGLFRYVWLGMPYSAGAIVTMSILLTLEELAGELLDMEELKNEAK